MTDSTNKTKRPSSISLITVFAMGGGFLSFYAMLSQGFQTFVQAHGVGNTTFFAFGGIVGIAIGVGFWLMKKWAVYTLIAFAVINQVYLLLVGRWNMLSFCSWPL